MDTPKRLIRFLILAGLAGGLLLFVFSVAGLAKLIIVSALLAYIADPIAVFLESRGMSRTAATVVIFLCSLAAAVFAILLLLPLLAAELDSIREGFLSGRTSESIAALGQSLEQHLSVLGIHHLNLPDRIRSATTSAGEWALSHMLDMVSVMTELVIVPFIVFFLLKDGRDFKKALIRLVPNRYFEFSLNMIYKMDLQLGNYLRGQFLDAVIFGLLSVIALWILNIKYFIAIGIFSGVANLIPFLGPVVGAAVAMIVAVVTTGSMVPAFSVLIAFVVLKLIDDSLVQPIIVARSVDMHPLVVLLAVIIGGKFSGILGMILAVPVTGFLKIVLGEVIGTLRRYHLAQT